MRATLRDVRRHPSWLLDWWIDWPARRGRFWRTLLFEPGQGWLRWSLQDRTGYIDHGEIGREPYPYTVAPPARRLARYLHQWPRALRVMVFGVPRQYRFDPARRERLSWEEMRPTWPDWMKDTERSRDIWGETPYRKRRRAFVPRPR